MDDTMLKKWEPAAYALEDAPDKLPVPLEVLTGESIDVARFGKRYWDDLTDSHGKVIGPGLKSAVGNGTFNRELLDEIVELNQALHLAGLRYNLTIQNSGAAPMEDALFLLGEVRSALRWLFDDGVLDDSDAQLANLERVHENARSQDALAVALFDFAGLAAAHREKLAGLGGFDPALIDRALEMSKQLEAHSAGPEEREVPGARQALDLRNRIGALLYERMQRVRAAARFAFRNNPDAIREVTSRYGRQQRANHRARQAKVGEEPAQQEPVETPAGEETAAE